MNLYIAQEALPWKGIGGKYIEKIEGCFSNVMGLSLPWLRKHLYKKEN